MCTQKALARHQTLAKTVETITKIKLFLKRGSDEHASSVAVPRLLQFHDSSRESMFNLKVEGPEELPKPQRSPQQRHLEVANRQRGGLRGAGVPSTFRLNIDSQEGS